MKESWPFIEARKVINRVKRLKKDTIIFETGYGPSGLPHLGTFTEVKRTELIINAVKELSGNILKTKLYVVSDDLDALRKVPDNIPNKDEMEKYIGYPLSSIPDPFGEEDSYGTYMNNKLLAFLKKFVKCDYEFKSATACYKAGIYNEKLILLLHHYDEVMNLMLKNVGEERQKTYSPFLPISPINGKVLQVKIEDIDLQKNTISFYDVDNTLKSVPVTDGHCKLQWKPDWGMRWAAFQVDYEMHGKDLTPSAVISTKICRLLQEASPELFVYELFLDHEGKKISKSKGNGVSLEEWTRYGSEESLIYYMFNKPKVAKKLSIDTIPSLYDEYLQNIQSYHIDRNIYHPVYSIYYPNPVPQYEKIISYGLVLNVLIACNIEDINLLWKFLKKYNPKLLSDKIVIELAEYAFRYYNDRLKNNKNYAIPSEDDCIHLEKLISSLNNIEIVSPASVQQSLYDTAKECGYSRENMKQWFQMLYQTILGVSEGPRLGSFIAFYGIKESIILIQDSIQRKQS